MGPIIIVIIIIPIVLLLIGITYTLYNADDYFIGIVVSKTKEYYYVDNLISKSIIKCKSNKNYKIGDRVSAFRKYLTWYLA